MIPFTARCEAHSTRTHRMWIYKHLVDDPALLSGRVMAVLNAKIEGYTHRNEAYGAVSGGVYSRMPPLVRRAYAHPYDVYEIKIADARRYTLMRLSAEHTILELVDASETPRIGERIEFVVGYGDTTVHLHDELYGIRDGRVESVWSIARGTSR